MGGRAGINGVRFHQWRGFGKAVQEIQNALEML